MSFPWSAASPGDMCLQVSFLAVSTTNEQLSISNRISVSEAIVSARTRNWVRTSYRRIRFAGYKGKARWREWLNSLLGSVRDDNGTRENGGENCWDITEWEAEKSPREYTETKKIEKNETVRHTHARARARSFVNTLHVNAEISIFRIRLLLQIDCL
jgi:hypothetical protein